MVSGRGSHFDPVLIDLFSQANEEFQLLYDSLK
jgi:HD-GYP domain-containing protein (c-di-GMP phosphodiesterase class II)